MNIEELLITLKMLGYNLINIDWKSEKFIYFEIQILDNYDEKIINDIDLIINKYKNLHYKYSFILHRCCIIVHDKKDF